jgi:ABC-type transport system involved in cytochrome bd biosynthesis fused ATPase/permease subunit
MTAPLSLRSVTYRYPASRAPALHNVSLDVRSGEEIAVIGSVGARAETQLRGAAHQAPRVPRGQL